MHFYPQLRRDEILAMKRSELDALWAAITIIEAERHLVAIRIASFPYASKEGQEAIHKELHKKAYPELYSKPVELTAEKVLTMDEFAELMSGRR